MPFAVYGSRAAFFLPAGRFLLCGAFSFFGRVFLYAVFVFGRSVAFLGHCGRCFRFGVAFCLSVLLLRCSVTPLKLSVLHFVYFLV